MTRRSHTVCAVVALLVGVGCPHPKEQPGLVPQSVAATLLPVTFAGVVVANRFEDRDGRFTIEAPDGWTVRPGLQDESLRVTLRHIDTGTVVQVWRRAGEQLDPEAREGCDWSFADVGPYRTLRVAGPVGAATCVPHDPEEARAFAWLHATMGSTWSVEVLPPSEQLLIGLDAGRAVVATARWRQDR